MTDPGARYDRPEPRRRRGRGERVLVTEDDDRVRVLVSRVLTRSGYQVVTASGGMEALGILRSGEPPVGLLLSDVVMRGMSGTELAERTRALLPDTPILLMSGHKDRSILGGSPERLIKKPFTNSALLGAVADALHPSV